MSEFAQAPGSMLLSDLPPELLAHVFKYLESKELLISSVVCRKFEDVANENFLWKEHLEDLFTPEMASFALQAMQTGTLTLPTPLPKEIRASEMKIQFARAIQRWIPDHPTAERNARLVRQHLLRTRPRQFETLKIVFLGDSKIGRTCQLIHYCYHPDVDLMLDPANDGTRALEHLLPPRDRFGVNQFRSNIFLNEGIKVSHQIWAHIADPPSPSSSYSNTLAVRSALKGADTIFLGFSIVDPASFASVESNWIPLIRKYLLDVPILLLGLKADLRTDQETLARLAAAGKSPVAPAEAQELVKKHKLVRYLETSVLADNLTTIPFLVAARDVLGEEMPDTPANCNVM